MGQVQWHIFLWSNTKIKCGENTNKCVYNVETIKMLCGTKSIVFQKLNATLNTGNGAVANINANLVNHIKTF